MVPLNQRVNGNHSTFMFICILGKNIWYFFIFLRIIELGFVKWQKLCHKYIEIYLKIITYDQRALVKLLIYDTGLLSHVKN